MRTAKPCTRRSLGNFGSWLSIVLGFSLLFFQHSASAEIWGFVNEQGVAHFATQRLDERYQIFFRGAQDFDTSAGVKGPSNGPNAALQPSATSRATAFFEGSPRYQGVKHHLREAARTHEIDYELLQALIATESGFDALAVSPKGAIGLMQLMPDTAARFGVSGDKTRSLAMKLADPKINIKAGSRYLQYLIDLFPGQLELALAAYNAGEGAVQRAGNKIPNFKETQNYVRTVMQLYTLLKPDPMAARRQAPARVRMQLQGGAINRGNLISRAPSMMPQPSLQTEADTSRD